MKVRFWLGLSMITGVITGIVFNSFAMSLALCASLGCALSAIQLTTPK